MTEAGRRLWKAGLVLGIGLGGFFDGILFHQILQLHNMVSNRLFPDSLARAEINMFWDGIFHALTWLATVYGLRLLWVAVREPAAALRGRTLVGSMLFGHGLFNLLEGLIDHHWLQVHHVVQRAPEPARFFWDLAFLASGLALMAAGWLLAREPRAAGDATTRQGYGFEGRAPQST